MQEADIQRRLDAHFGSGTVRIRYNTFVSIHKPAVFVHATEGEWTTTAGGPIYAGKGHPNLKGKKISYSKTQSAEAIQARVMKAHDNLVVLDQNTYTNITSKAKFIDKEYGEWWALPSNVVKGSGHPQRAITSNSKYDYGGVTLREWCLANDIDYHSAASVFRNLGSSHFESWLESYTTRRTQLEIFASSVIGVPVFDRGAGVYRYRPDFQLSESLFMNVDGLYWHSFDGVESNRPGMGKIYHNQMRIDYESHGKRILQFYSDEMYTHPEKIKSMVNHLRGRSGTRIHARECEVKGMSGSHVQTFLNQTHLMGSLHHKQNLCLVMGDTILGCATYSIRGLRMNISRMSFALGVSISGGSSRLLRHLQQIATQKGCTRMDYWVDLRYGVGHHLLQQGFSHARDTIGWCWTDGKRRYNRLHCRAGDGMTENEAASAKKLLRIFDAGQRLYIKDIT